MSSKKKSSKKGGSGADGHTVLPSAYFGTNSSSYFSDATYTNVLPSDLYARPAILYQNVSKTGGTGASASAGINFVNKKTLQKYIKENDCKCGSIDNVQKKINKKIIEILKKKN